MTHHRDRGQSVHETMVVFDFFNLPPIVDLLLDNGFPNLITPSDTGL